ncbi:PDDEXK nuclease domain-containing protein [Hallerella succinigenes]|uniref:Putative nuclease of restriction endonuclease-like (RecB) superfamily n=1 Tax=Hallerella succinigenes TaxID=1896222 RepID=A0A2M9A7S9_9BACT|nr:PDDEXK nuclease domain-containing protein [Hallerella succinigenes]PJJ41708.1 putative nuclease of restriction endonuclease-like (RecB) superfamily [Hallerella succinigenes]
MKNENIPEEKDARKGFSDESGLVRFTAPPESVEMDKTYSDFINSLVQDVHKTRISVVLASNSAMITLYWNIGNEILKKQKELGWGAKVIDRIAFDLKKAFPEMKGFSPRNIKYMRKFAETWVDKEIMQQVVAQIPWRSNLILLEKLNDQEKRIWYAKMTLKNGWSSNILQLQIESKAKERMGKALSNFKLTLPDKESDLVNNIFKDPYLFDFLGTDVPRREVEVEKKLTEHIQEFLLELGQGFAFVGRQVHLELGGDDFYIDMLFYHLKLRCYVIVELKVCEFDPGFVSKLNMYVNAVNRILNHPDDKPAIGLLLVKGKNETVVKYSLDGLTNPIGVADWQDKLNGSLPAELKSSLPSIEEIEASLKDGEAL